MEDGDIAVCRKNNIVITNQDGVKQQRDIITSQATIFIGKEKLPTFLC